MSTVARLLLRTIGRGLLVAGLALATAQAAIVPSTIGYQGFLRDGAGAPVNGTVNLTFRIYTEQAGGPAAIWQETHNNVPVSAGAFSVRLGSITSLSDDATGIRFDRPLFLSVQVNGDAEMSPRLAFDVSPYAFTARILDAEVAVNCNTGGSIMNIIDDAVDAFALSIDISGVCEENVFIDRDRVTITSSDQTGVIRGSASDPTPGNAVVAVGGVQSVLLENLIIEGAPGDDTGKHGLLLADNAQVTVRDSIIRNANGRGILVVENSSLDLWGSEVHDNDLRGISLWSNSHIDIENSTIRDNGDEGVFLGLGSSADIDNTIVRNNASHGVHVFNGASARIYNGSLIELNGTPGTGLYAQGLFVNEGSSARLENSTVTSEQQYGDDGGAIAVYRGSNLRLIGSNTVSAPFPPDPECLQSQQNCGSFGAGGGGIAFDVEMNSTLRQDAGQSTVTGNIFSYNLSTVDMRNMVHNGPLVFAQGLNANVRLRDQSPAGTNDDPTVTGLLAVSGSSELSLRNKFNSQRSIINGDVWCANSSIWVDPNLLFLEPGQGYINCPSVSADLQTEIAGPLTVTNDEVPHTYTATITNLSAASPRVDAVNTNVSVSLVGAPVALGALVIDNVVDSDDSAGVDCNHDGFGTINCHVPRIAGGGSFSVSFDVIAPEGRINDQFDLQAQAFAQNPEPDTSNNTQSLQFIDVVSSP